MFIFIGLGQGKDVIITFIENTDVKHSTQANAFWHNFSIQCAFFLAIIFWVYVSWYSSRIISYIKKNQQFNYLQQFNDTLTEKECCDKYEVRETFLDHFPRIIGYACFLVLILAFVNLLHPSWITSTSAFIILFVCLLILWLLDSRFIKLSDDNPKLIRNLFNYSGMLFLFLLVIFQLVFPDQRKRTVFILLLLGLVVYFFYINLRRIVVKNEELKQKSSIRKDNFLDSFLKRIMTKVDVPTKEVGYFKWFNIFSVIGLAVYIAATLSYKIAVLIGPFPLVLLAFAMLLGFANIITMFSVKTKVNLHFIIFTLAALWPVKESHYVRQVPIKDKSSFTSYAHRESIDQHFISWLKNHNELDTVRKYPVYFVLANGGASRSGYWVASVLGRLEDASITNTPNDRFSSHVFCLSGTSGGGVGVASFFTLLMHSKNLPAKPKFEESAKNFLKQDFLTHTLARMLGPDYFRFLPFSGDLLHLLKVGDRAKALEHGFESCKDDSYYPLHFDSTYMYQCVTQQNSYSSLPVLCVNTTRVQDGNPGVVCTIRLNDPVFNKRVDVLSLLNDNSTIRLSTAAILGARFPYVSPAGRIDSIKTPNYFVDGGYFDNSGAGVVQEMITAILRTCDSVKDEKLRSRIKKLQLVVLHITNSPQGSANLERVTPFKNDISAPLLTILGAYDMQTTVNDRRLESFINSSTIHRDSLPPAVYYPIHLYNDPSIDSDNHAIGPFAMNWFISDSVLNGMNNRLNAQPRLRQLIYQQRVNDVHLVDLSKK
jgi:hypothetical protein